MTVNIDTLKILGFQIGSDIKNQLGALIYIKDENENKQYIFLNGNQLDDIHKRYCEEADIKLRGYVKFGVLDNDIRLKEKC